MYKFSAGFKEYRDGLFTVKWVNEKNVIDSFH